MRGVVDGRIMHHTHRAALHRVVLISRCNPLRLPACLPAAVPAATPFPPRPRQTHTYTYTYTIGWC